MASGRVTLAARVAGAPPGTRVRWLLDGFPLASDDRVLDPLPPPARLSWKTANAWNGVKELQAVALDEAGVEIARSEPVSFRVADAVRAGDEDLHPYATLEGPARLDGLSGTVELAFRVHRDGLSPRNDDPSRPADSRWRGAAWKVSRRVGISVDGVDRPAQWTGADLVRVTLDTARLADGEHFLHLAVLASLLHPPWRPATEYRPGDTVAASKLAYTCVQGGLSAASGEGPKGNGLDVPDGEARWRHAGGDLNVPLADLRVRFTTRNGAVPRELRPSHTRLYLVPGESFRLAFSRRRCDGTEEPLPAREVALASRNPAVASVDAEGLVSAGGAAPGLTLVTARDGTRTTVVEVYLHPRHAMPHLDRDGGGVLLDSLPGRSAILRSLFVSGGADQKSYPGRRPWALAERMVADGFTNFEEGIYLNPRNPPQPFEQWAPGYDRWKAPAAEALERFPALRLYAAGDDIGRRPVELASSVGGLADRHLQHAMAWARAHRVTGIDMIDEVDMLWGGRADPRPDDPWAKRDPPLRNTAFRDLMRVLNATPGGRPPVTWSTLGDGNWFPETNWTKVRRIDDVEPFSDFAGLYWSPNRAFSLTALGHYPWQWVRVAEARTLPGRDFDFDHGAPPDGAHRWDQPTVMIVPGAGAYYQRMAAGSDRFVAGQDLSLLPVRTSQPRNIGATIWYAMLQGCAGYRAYFFDSGQTRRRRETAPPGAVLESGTNPWDFGNDRWAALAAANRLVARLEPLLLQPPDHAASVGSDADPDDWQAPQGRELYTGARRGPRGNLFIALNLAGLPRRVAPDLSRYLTGGRTTRYRQVADRTLERALDPASPRDEVTLDPGEAAIWAFEAPAAAGPGPGPPPAGPGRMP